jgi:hypothetical protein
MGCLKLGNLVLGPGVAAVRVPVAKALYTQGRISRDEILADGVIQDHAQRLQQVISRFRRVGLCGDDVANMDALQVLERAVAMIAAKAFEDAPPLGLRTGPHAAEFGRVVVLDTEGRERARKRAYSADLCPLALLAFKRRRVLAHEVLGPWDAGEIDRHATPTKAHPPLAVRIRLVGAMFW